MHLLAPALAALLAFVALWPASGIDTEPPECYALPGYVVPCAPGFALAGAIAAAACVAVGITIGRRRALRRGRAV